VLAHLRNGETFAGLAAGFGVGTATAGRYARETITLLAARAPKLRDALAAASTAGHAFVVIDRTLIPIDRVAADRVSGPLPGAVHDLTAARIWGIIREPRRPG
jgi:DDE superfamily endonuclease